MKIEFDGQDFALVIIALTLIALCFICSECEKTKIKTTGKPDISITQ